VGKHAAQPARRSPHWGQPLKWSCSACKHATALPRRTHADLLRPRARADGFGGGWGRTQILRILRDSRVGTYALVGVALLLQIKLTALQSLKGGGGQA
jgi:hypothetical protein